MSEVLFAGNIANGLPAAAEDSLQLKLNLAIGFRNDPPLATPSSRTVTGMEVPDPAAQARRERAVAGALSGGI